METVRACQVAGNAPWEMKSLCPQQCVSREQRIKGNEERQNEKCVVRAEVRAGNVFSLLQLLRFINTPFLFMERAHRHLNYTQYVYYYIRIYVYISMYNEYIVEKGYFYESNFKMQMYKCKALTYN